MCPEVRAETPEETGCNLCHSTVKVIILIITALSALHSQEGRKINLVKLTVDAWRLLQCLISILYSEQVDRKTKGDLALFIPDKRPRKVRAGIDIAARSPWQWLCSCVIVHCDGRAARWHWCRTSASGWETELPFRLSERKHSREKWQEASRAFWFRSRWHRHNSQKQSGPPLEVRLETHVSTIIYWSVLAAFWNLKLDFSLNI